jgi:hypothetical protein
MNANLENQDQNLAKQLEDTLLLLAQVTLERDIAQAQLNTPELHDFAKGVVLEAAHQRLAWSPEHDAQKSAPDWFWLLGYLVGKAVQADKENNTDKVFHHIITTAAACANWHAHVTRENINTGEIT